MMECQDVRQLLAFVDRASEELDAPEQEAVKQHLETCVECAELAQTERRADDAFGAVMRDVPVPAHLKQKVMKRLAADRGRGARPVTWIAAAAAILIAVSGGLYWNQVSRPFVTDADAQWVVARVGMDEAQAEQYFAEQGLQVKVPRDFEYGNLQHVDVVKFKGRWVAQMIFSRTEENRSAIATVLVLPAHQFRLNDLKNQVIPGSTSIRVRSEERNNEHFTDLIYYRGNLDWLRRDLN